MERKIIILEAHSDHYFSDNGRFAPNFHSKISALGAAVFRAKFHPFPYHPRSHHALSLDQLQVNCAAEITANMIPLTLKENIKISRVIAKEVFFTSGEEWHNCFYVCGNDTTLDIATAGEAVPLLSAFIKEYPVK